MDRIDLKTLNMEELAGVVSLYPWYGSARKEICRRMAALGGEGWSEEEYVDAALYVNNRRMIYDIMHGKDAVRKAPAKGLPAAEGRGAGSVTEAKEAPATPVRRTAGTDYFASEELEKVRREGDDVFARKSLPAEREESEKVEGNVVIDVFCTETLAHIYEEQGYFEQAERIYSQLILRYPEKSAYFASLIEKIKKN